MRKAVRPSADGFNSAGTINYHFFSEKNGENSWLV